VGLDRDAHALHQRRPRRVRGLLGHPRVLLGDPLTEADTEVLDCLLDGLTACDPVRATLTRCSIEGDPIPVTYYVVPEGEDCTAAVFSDTTEDAFGPREVRQDDCEAVVEVEECPWVTAEDCTPIESEQDAPSSRPLPPRPRRHLDEPDGAAL